MFLKSTYIALALCLISGCSQEGPATPSPTEATPSPETATATTKPKQAAIPGAQTFEKDGITAEIASWEHTQEFIQKQKGKVVVLDLWSTWCEPCLREFPHLVELHKQFPEKVICISFNLNYDGSKNYPPESNEEELMEFYVKQKADIVNIISSTPDQDLYQSINLAAIPAAYVYGPDGKLAKRFDNEKLEYGQEGFTYEKHIAPFVEQLLQQSSKPAE